MARMHSYHSYSSLFMTAVAIKGIVYGDINGDYSSEEKALNGLKLCLNNFKAYLQLKGVFNVKINSKQSIIESRNG